MAYCDAFANNLECVIEYNNLITYKCIVLGLLFIYSAYILFKNRESWGDTDNMFDFFKTLLQKSISLLYFIFLPLLLMMLRPTVTFEIFILFIIVFYLMSTILFVALGILFGWEHIKKIFNVMTGNSFKEKMKYRGGSKYDD